jgi:hypothetical protein
MIKILYTIIILLLISSGAEAHTGHYQVENRGISVRVFCAEVISLCPIIIFPFLKTSLIMRR